MAYSSDSDADHRDRAAIASRARPSTMRSALPAQRLESYLQDREEDGRSSLEDRLYTAQYSFPSRDPASAPRSVAGSYASESSSMAMTSSSRTSYRDSTAPSLASSYRSYSTNTSSSANTSNASYILSKNYQSLPEEGEDQPTAAYDCALGFLGCDDQLSDFDEWDTHCRAHFRGKLPRKLECPMVGCTRSFRAETGEEAWEQQRSHIQRSHGRNAQVDTGRRPSVDLIKHLWRERLISDAQEQELRSDGRVNGSVFLENARSERQRRARGSGRGP